ncbi:MAG: pentapeptide repeat-containing protein [Anaerolineae bacterium]|nr:pentapeptide repeat-containing protein [Anaerolineae bacterium]
MANPKHLEILKQGVEVWNRWRLDNPIIRPELHGVNLSGADLSEVDFRKTNLFRANLDKTNLLRADFRMANLQGVNLQEANLNGATLSGVHLFRVNLNGAHLLKANLEETNLTQADLSQAYLNGAYLHEATLEGTNLKGANLSEANLYGANLFKADMREVDLTGANLTEAYLHGANLNRANLTDANLFRADLSEANLGETNLHGVNLSRVNFIDTNLSGAYLINCNIYGISTWDIKLEGAIQQDLIITKKGQPIITVDNLEVAQFIYLLIHNEKLRDVIDTVGKKAVLILGRFTPKRKAVLNAIRDELRERNYIPILFDFEKPSSRDLTETISILAHIARFIIADITHPSSIPHELQAIVPNLQSVPIQPIIHISKTEYALFESLRKHRHWVLETYHYRDQAQLISEIDEKIIEPAEAKVKELRGTSTP